MVEAVELRLPLRLTLIPSSHQRELKGSVQRHGVYNRSQRKRLSEHGHIVIDKNKQKGSNHFIVILRLQRY